MFIHPIIPNGAKRTAETRDFMFIFREMVIFSDNKKAVRHLSTKPSMKDSCDKVFKQDNKAVFILLFISAVLANIGHRRWNNRDYPANLCPWTQSVQ